MAVKKDLLGKTAHMNVLLTVPIQQWMGKKLATILMEHA
jgi:hypothetical protein